MIAYVCTKYACSGDHAISWKTARYKKNVQRRQFYMYMWFKVQTFQSTTRSTTRPILHVVHGSNRPTYHQYDMTPKFKDQTIQHTTKITTRQILHVVHGSNRSTYHLDYNISQFYMRIRGQTVQHTIKSATRPILHVVHGSNLLFYHQRYMTSKFTCGSRTILSNIPPRLQHAPNSICVSRSKPSNLRPRLQDVQPYTGGLLCKPSNCQTQNSIQPLSHVHVHNLVPPVIVTGVSSCELGKGQETNETHVTSSLKIYISRSCLKLTCRHINRRHICFNIKSISVHPLLWMNVMLDFICMVFAGMWTTFR